ncbi:MAG: hypothetical protein IPP46_06165 [Bacteroidetes bacterium]|nr:hypothetical protein [Bacteroidota bacterium]
MQEDARAPSNNRRSNTLFLFQQGDGLGFFFCCTGAGERGGVTTASTRVREGRALGREGAF